MRTNYVIRQQNRSSSCLHNPAKRDSEGKWVRESSSEENNNKKRKLQDPELPTPIRRKYVHYTLSRTLCSSLNRRGSKNEQDKEQKLAKNREATRTARVQRGNESRQLQSDNEILRQENDDLRKHLDICESDGARNDYRNIPWKELLSDKWPPMSLDIGS